MIGQQKNNWRETEKKKCRILRLRTLATTLMASKLPPLNYYKYHKDKVGWKSIDLEKKKNQILTCKKIKINVRTTSSLAELLAFL